MIAARLIDSLHMHDLLDLMQSAYRAAHSTETAMLKFHNVIVHTVDGVKWIFLVLLDLSVISMAWKTIFGYSL